MSSGSGGPPTSGEERVDLTALARKARESGDWGPFARALPFARFAGIEDVVLDERAGGPRRSTAILRYAPHVVGNSLLPALHGGAVGALLECASMFELLRAGHSGQFPKIVNITIQYLRSAHATDTFARAEITRKGRRVANVRAVAWQESPEKPVATSDAQFLLAETVTERDRPAPR